MTDPNFIAGSECLDFVTAVESIVKRSCIIDYGIVQQVPAEGLVDVAVAVTDTKQNMICMTCVLANIASSSLTVKVKPNVGDRVLVVYPRTYNDEMFTVPDSDMKKKELIVSKRCKGYNIMSGIAILINQYRTATHKNYIQVEDGKVEVELAYDKDNDENLLSFSTDADGAINVTSKNYAIAVDKDGVVSMGTDNYAIAVDKDGYLSYTNKKDNKSQLTFTSSGMTLQDKNGCKIVTDQNYTTINGNLKVKNG